MVYAAGNGLMPQSIKVQFIYFKEASLAGEDEVHQVSFSPTDLTDLTGTGAGVRPRGFTEWMVLYSRFRVVKVEILNRVCTTTANMDTLQGMYSLPHLTPIMTDLTDIMEWRHTHSVSYISNERPSTRHGYFIPWFAEGVSREQWMTEDDYAGSPTVSPAVNPKFSCWACPADNASDVFTVWGITMRFTTILDMPQDLEPSVFFEALAKLQEVTTSAMRPPEPLPPQVAAPVNKKLSAKK